MTRGDPKTTHLMFINIADGADVGFDNMTSREFGLQLARASFSWTGDGSAASGSYNQYGVSIASGSNVSFSGIFLGSQFRDAFFTVESSSVAMDGVTINSAVL